MERVFPVKVKGQAAEAFLPSRAAIAGPQENILRTVTKVERYHSGSVLFAPFAVNVGALSKFTVFCLRKEERK